MFSGVARLIANHPHLTFFESTPEARVLCSAGVTRPRRSYDPVRLPPWPPPTSNVEAATLAQDGSPLITRTTIPTCHAHYPGGSSGCSCRLLPRSCSLPQMAGGSASALSLSRPAQASLTLWPAESLSRPWRPLSRGSGPSAHPAEPLVSYQINRQFSGWCLPPQVIRAFGAHAKNRLAPVADVASSEPDKDRRESHAPRPLHRLPEGGGRGGSPERRG
jgi:hypothetical protein